MMRLTATELEYVEVLYREMSTLLLNYAKRLLLNKSLAEEAMQETFVIACQRLDSLKSSPNPQGWLMNTLKYAIRKSKTTSNLHSRYILLLDDLALYVADPKAHHPNPAVLYRGLIREEDYHVLSRLGIDGYSTSGILWPAGRGRFSNCGTLQTPMRTEKSLYSQRQQIQDYNRCIQQCRS